MFNYPQLLEIANQRREGYALAAPFPHTFVDDFLPVEVAREAAAAIIINPGAFTHTSIAILDALNAFEGPVVEVHISNIHKRETFRHHSYVSLRADGVIAGCGVHGYELAVEHVARRLPPKA